MFMFTEADRQVLLTLLHRVTRMSIDVSGIKTSAEHLQGTVVKLIALVEAALASNNPQQDALVQTALNDIKTGLDNTGALADAEVAKAATGASPAPTATPAAETPPAA